MGGRLWASFGRGRAPRVARESRDSRGGGDARRGGGFAGVEDEREKRERVALRGADVLSRERLRLGAHRGRDGVRENRAGRRRRRLRAFGEEHATSSRSEPRARRVEREESTSESEEDTLTPNQRRIFAGDAVAVTASPSSFRGVLFVGERFARRFRQRRERLEVRRDALENFHLDERRGSRSRRWFQNRREKTQRGRLPEAAVHDATRQRPRVLVEMPSTRGDDVLWEILQKRLPSLRRAARVPRAPRRTSPAPADPLAAHHDPLAVRHPEFDAWMRGGPGRGPGTARAQLRGFVPENDRGDEFGGDAQVRAERDQRFPRAASRGGRVRAHARRDEHETTR